MSAEAMPGLPPAFPPAWACGWGEDRHGVFAEIALGAEARGEGVTLELRWIAPGSFSMSSPEREVGRWEYEGPQHEVTISRGFWLGATPVTQEQWRAVVGSNPSRFKGAKRPVEQVSWEECVAWCGRVNELLPGLGARLPSEAEWEYACRAGTKSAFNNGADCTVPNGEDPALAALGWYDRNSNEETHPVGLKKPNRWGLKDMHGNVWEWCLDLFGESDRENPYSPTGPKPGTSRVVRGGSSFNLARNSRSASRGGSHLGVRYVSLGFRLAAREERESGTGKPERGRESSDE